MQYVFAHFRAWSAEGKAYNNRNCPRERMPASFLAFDFHFGSFTLSINLSPLILSETVALWRRYQIYRGKVKRKRRLLYAPREKAFMISSVEFGENFLSRR